MVANVRYILHLVKYFLHFFWIFLKFLLFFWGKALSLMITEGGVNADILKWIPAFAGMTDVVFEMRIRY